jgi:hypothetical protein
MEISREGERERDRERERKIKTDSDERERERHTPSFHTLKKLGFFYDGDKSRGRKGENDRERERKIKTDSEGRERVEKEKEREIDKMLKNLRPPREESKKRSSD